MPTVSPAQKRLMLAVDHGWHKPGGGGPTKAVAHEFVEADKQAGRVMSNKGYMGKTEHYAQGGPVQGTVSRFLKTEDQFRAAYHINPGAGKDKPYGKSGLNSGRGEDPPPAAKGKSEKPVKPRK